MSGLLLAFALRAKLLALVTLLAFFVGENLAELAQVNRLAGSLRQLAAALAQKLNRASRSTAARLHRGIIVAALLVVPAMVLGIVLSGNGIFLRVLTIVLLITLLGRGFTTATLFKRWQLAREGKLALEAEDRLFGDTHGVLRHLILTSAEGFATNVVGGGFWFALGGFPLMLPYLALAMAHGRYATGRDADLPFAWAATTAYRLADTPPRFIASLLLVISGFFVPRTRPLKAIGAFTSHEETWYGLVASLLDISLGGRVKRAAGELTLPWLGGGSAQLTQQHLTRWMAVLGVATLLWLVLLALPGYSLIS